MSKVSRRDFLKLAGLTSGALAMSQLSPESLRRSSNSLPNIVIVLFDAMTARDLSLYGFKRHTTPNFEKFAQKAIVYNAHHSGGNFTTPGTATLLTGTYPWTHRAFDIAGVVEQDRVKHNIFTALGNQYHRLAFSQNLLPNYFFGQFHRDIDTILPASSFSAIEQVHGEWFKNDLDGAYRSYDNFMFQDGVPPASLVFGLADRILLRRREASAHYADYPRGLPRAGDHPIFFQLKDVFNGLMATLDELKSVNPYCAYLHVWPPHAPYKATREFDSKFQDNYHPINKPDNRLGDHTPNSSLNSRRQNYDEFIANADNEFGRLMKYMESNGVLDNSYVFVVADHGESFERGVEGHVTKLLYEPLIHIPLIVSVPGQQTRQDIYTPTSNADILPTLMHLSGQSIPDWTEGTVLPGLGGVVDPSRSIFSMEAKTNSAYAPLTKATLTMRKGDYKLIYYTGFEPQDSFELYNLAEDYEELNDLYPKGPSIAKALKDELLQKLDSVNAPYRRKA